MFESMTSAEMSVNCTLFRKDSLGAAQLLWTSPDNWKYWLPFVRIIRFPKCSSAQFDSGLRRVAISWILSRSLQSSKRKINRYSIFDPSIQPKGIFSHMLALSRLRWYLIWINHCMRQPLHFNSSIFMASLPLAHNTHPPLVTLEYASGKPGGPAWQPRTWRVRSSHLGEHVIKGVHLLAFRCSCRVNNILWRRNPPAQERLVHFYHLPTHRLGGISLAGHRFMAHRCQRIISSWGLFMIILQVEWKACGEKRGPRSSRLKEEGKEGMHKANQAETEGEVNN